MINDPYVSKNPDYKDLDLDFLLNPATKDIVKKTGVEAIKRSVRNIILTNTWERPFASDIGSDIRELLFENASPFTSAILKQRILDTLQAHEPRIRVTSDGVIVTDDSDNNGYNIRLEYIIINRELPVVSTLFLERIR